MTFSRILGTVEKPRVVGCINSRVTGAWASADGTMQPLGYWPLHSRQVSSEKSQTQAMLLS